MFFKNYIFLFSLFPNLQFTMLNLQFTMLNLQFTMLCSTNLFVFSSQVERDLWWSKLAHLTSQEREHSPAGASINITYFDNSTNFEHVGTLNSHYILFFWGVGSGGGGRELHPCEPSCVFELYLYKT